MNEKIIDLAIRRFGHEDPRTIAIATLVEWNAPDLAENLLNAITEEEK